VLDDAALERAFHHAMNALRALEQNMEVLASRLTALERRLVRVEGPPSFPAAP
jgi:hypothetical protein